jgi:hypothetical protein
MQKSKSIQVKKTFWILLLSSIGILTEVPEITAVCIVFVLLLLAVKNK